MPREIRFTNPNLERKYLRFRMFLDTYKMERGCSECGYHKHPAALVLDHIDPKLKVVQISCMYSYSWEAIHRELEKCVVLCANCHQIKTWEAGEMGPPQLPAESDQWSLFDDG